MSDTRPNIILIITDQQRSDTINALGAKHMRTPNIDRLVNEGVSFENCFISGPTCVPSRAALFTGNTPHTTGIYRNADKWRHSWVELLNKGGYHCVNIGKMHTFPLETEMGFHERFVVENKDRYLEHRYYFDRWDMALQTRGYKKPQRELYREREDYNTARGAFEWSIPEDLHPDFYTADMAKRWLEIKPKSEEPLFMQIGFPGPHPPFDAIGRYTKEYMDKDIPLPELRDDDYEQQTGVLKRLNEENIEVDHDSVKWGKDDLNLEQIRKMRASYYGNITMIDEKIGELMETLDKKGYLENSIVIFTSDHGDSMGDHWQIEKWNMYDEIVRVPMVVWYPKKFKGNHKVKELVQLFDIAPVILESAEIEVPSTFEAQSFMPALKGEDFKGREYVFCEQGEDVMLRKAGCKQLTMIRNEEWKLVHYLGKDEGELYHLVDDPKEFKNLWNSKEHIGTKNNLLQAMLEWNLETGLKTDQLYSEHR